jgi:tetraacyldisaccharide 4'-kinase
VPLDRLKDRPVAAFCGIGNPRAFRRTLDNLGAAVADFRTFPDHHPYSRADVEDLRDWARRQATDCMVLTTQKDLVKLSLPQLGGRDLWAVRIGLHIESGREELHHKLEEAVSSQQSAVSEE